MPLRLIRSFVAFQTLPLHAHNLNHSSICCLTDPRMSDVEYVCEAFSGACMMTWRAGWALFRLASTISRIADPGASDVEGVFMVVDGVEYITRYDARDSLTRVAEFLPTSIPLLILVCGGNLAADSLLPFDMSPR
ncbi:hypothetical protein K443DRAFT_124469 [Laccaria amethystina LaAM-08-1]|uniref:Uncharacterized protein n=1 Tax=Laccaria amethystina LaAM-08-1 TaxID=1095629 RepID=A0A0C9XJN1_9AGAR|nr:hypothetical protein K443DRAFT_124469 [Laccaria amethystina LaAM-08-1]